MVPRVLTFLVNRLWLLLPLLCGLWLSGTVAGQAVNPDEADVEQRGLLQQILETETALAEQKWLEAVEKFDAAWLKAIEKEDPLLLFNGADVKQLAPGQTELRAGGKARLEYVFRNASEMFRTEYQKQFADLAEQQLDAAVRAGDRKELRRLSQRFLFCPSSRFGWLTLAGIAADRGDFLEAALLLNRIVRSGEDLDGTIRLRAAWCYAQAGRKMPPTLSVPCRRAPQRAR
jgi:hypothetical protein